MFSVRQTLEKVLKELKIQLQDWHTNIFTQQQKSCLTFLAMLVSDDANEYELDPLYKDLRSLMYSGMEMVPLVLRALVTLSERAETARKMKRVLRELLKICWEWPWDHSLMVMEIFRNVLGHLKKSEASSMAVRVVQRLWRLFEAVRLM
ncbi:hypothetical protein HGM15179_022278 [Zosterops borbonicus]|uniref:Uncharacterized protein n=1 Tax=Zosterops borbonicus TaxID=364589 RepID=A0A8K1D2W1_9PASS|nr:hypothetical protein HGM15179_022278 [Zosterops borbonicus]